MQVRKPGKASAISMLGHNVSKGRAMTITLDIKPETEDELLRQAKAHGVGMAAYASTLLEDAARAAAIKRSSADALDMVELFAPLRGLNMDFARDRDTGRDIEL